ncbi:MAG: phosphopantothenoylcysteine decarboxylase [Planctomycetota bacterium]|nr:MAG: phosphopantothenoylcysteine decarboxylase [Planctomycetota bacterium]
MKGARKGARRARRTLHVVVTAGPTLEYIDPVRYLANASSGRMGFAIAAAAVRAGHRVTLVTGPVCLATPKGVERIDVVSARDMLAALRRVFPGADALYMAAAVSDWRPRRRLAGKWRRKDGGDETATLELVRNPDVLATVARRKGGRLVVGFALETGDGIRRAKAKLQRKNADFVVLNDATALNATSGTVTILGSDGRIDRLESLEKPAIARILVGLLGRT